MKTHENTLNLGSIMDFRNEIYGISALLIAIFHICGPYCPSFIAPVILRGWGGVEIFLFLSAIGCWMSMRKNSALYFYKHRFQRLGITFLFLGLIWFSYENLFRGGLDIRSFIANISLYNCFANNPHTYIWWYVGFNFLMYAVYPALFKLKSARNGWIYISCLVVLCMGSEFILAYCGSLFYQKYEIMYSRIPIFLAGVLCAEYIAGQNSLTRRQLFICLAVGAMFYGLSFLPTPLIGDRWALGISGIGFVLGYSWLRGKIKANFVTKFLAFCGTMSLEIYMIHIVLYNVFRDYTSIGIVRISIIAASIFLSWLTLLTTKSINRILSTK